MTKRKNTTGDESTMLDNLMPPEPMKAPEDKPADAEMLKMKEADGAEAKRQKLAEHESKGALAKPAAAGARAIQGLPATDSAVGAAAAMLGLIERLATNPDIDVAKMQAFLDMQLKLMDRQAEVAFHRDFALMSAVLPRVTKKAEIKYDVDKNDKSKGQYVTSKYALFEDIDEVVRPIISEFGFTLEHTARTREGGGLICVSTLAHREGHKVHCELPLALDGSGGKNNLQGMGSTTSYGRRYGTCLLLNLITVGDDTDGNKEPAKLETDKAVEIDQRLRAMADGETYRPKFLGYMKAETVQDILEADYLKAVNALDARESAMKKAAAQAPAKS